jgi:ethanolamine utilization protein EutN
MVVGRVEGRATATIGHASLRGARLLVVQPLRSAPSDPVLAVDVLGAAPGCLVVISSDGKGARELLADETSPVRWTVVGILDEGQDLQALQ